MSAHSIMLERNMSIVVKLDTYIVVLLNAPDTVLIERAHGKRIDPETGGNLENVFLHSERFGV